MRLLRRCKAAFGNVTDYLQLRPDERTCFGTVRPSKANAARLSSAPQTQRGRLATLVEQLNRAKPRECRAFPHVSHASHR
jgi:hypothetical protein